MLVAGCVLFGANAANAQQAAPPAPDSEAASLQEARKANARKLYDRGATAYAEARYHAAADLFLETYRVFPTPQLLFNIARALDKVGNVSGALRYYRDYQREAPGGSDEAEVQSRIHDLEAQLEQRGTQQLTILSDPEGALLLLDGQAVGVTPFTGNLYPGKHRLELQLAGHKLTQDTVELDPHRAHEVLFKLSTEDNRAAEAAQAQAAQQTTAEVSAFSWAVLGSGVLLLGSALVVEMANPDSQGISRPAAFLGGAGLGGALVGGILLYRDLNPSVPQRSAHLKLSLSPHAGAAVLSGQF